MKSHTKALVGTVAAGAMAVASATPAVAGDRHRDRGIDAGDVIAGALIIGGIAAIASAVDNDRDDRRYRDRNYRDRDYRHGDRYDHRDRRYNNRDNVERAVEQCVRAAERQAERWTGSRAEVYEIRDVDRERRGFEVKGRIAVRDRYHRGGWNDYSRNRRNNGWDEGRFTCDVERGRVVDIDFSGIRGL
ncbi:hypothetical protein [Alteraurantiacibacter aquimixticola]|uniref:Uncharacterized protein n=1 Tax=Alteraurantiacibacter aquimixticola TaxID=2489173 RepID=A0A4V4U8L4_9SPHN|nr:hypothetical protein [Alteraurantiacibacter aquimixticola]TIX50413.1 hypothetical protein E5222_09065 [Alteraurantiacibacter aquimixticola]